MIFYMAAITKENIEIPFICYAKNKQWFRQHIVYNVGEYVIIIRGFAVVEPGGDPEQYFMPRDTPFIVWREDGGSREQLFFMKLDLKNPSECEGGDLSIDQAWDAVAAKIREEGSTDWPSQTCRRSMVNAVKRARDNLIEARRGTFWSNP